MADSQSQSEEKRVWEWDGKRLDSTESIPLLLNVAGTYITTMSRIQRQ